MDISKWKYWSFKITKWVGVDFSFLHRYVKYRDGIDFIHCDVAMSWFPKSFNPCFGVRLGICNIMLFSLIVYSTRQIKVFDEYEIMVDDWYLSQGSSGRKA